MILGHAREYDTRQLNALGMDVQTHLTMVLFIDDTRNPSCASGVLALTAPGSRVVRLCIEEVKRASRSAY
jgi:hypothetical protein